MDNIAFLNGALYMFQQWGPTIFLALIWLTLRKRGSN